MPFTVLKQKFDAELDGVIALILSHLEPLPVERSRLERNFDQLRNLRFLFHRLFSREDCRLYFSTVDEFIGRMLLTRTDGGANPAMPDDVIDALSALRESAMTAAAQI